MPTRPEQFRERQVEEIRIEVARKLAIYAFKANVRHESCDWIKPTAVSIWGHLDRKDGKRPVSAQLTSVIEVDKNNSDYEVRYLTLGEDTYEIYDDRVVKIETDNRALEGTEIMYLVDDVNAAFGGRY